MIGLASRWRETSAGYAEHHLRDARGQAGIDQRLQDRERASAGVSSAGLTMIAAARRERRAELARDD